MFQSNKIFYFITMGVFFLTGLSFQNQAYSVQILTDLSFLKAAGIRPQFILADKNLAIANISQYQAQALPHLSHQYKKCGGFEVLDQENAEEVLTNLSLNLDKDLRYFNLPFKALSIVENPLIKEAVLQVKEENIRSTVEWLSGFKSRYHSGPNKNEAILALKSRLETLVANSSFPVQIDLINHKKTSQQSLRVHIEGSKSPSEIVVLGGHIDSIAGFFGLGADTAPGADDNASGSAVVIETLRIFLIQPQPQRSVEFFFYAGEEVGLLGSSEIAQQYKEQSKNVVGIMQLDMTLFPGNGELVIGDFTDFTTPWLRDFMGEINRLYVGAKMVTDQCGYGCSDHASWYRQGFPTVMPFEATYKTMNQNIHTPEDIITPEMSFKHSAAFGKLAVAFTLELANSNLRVPAY
jgi:leucyl aminopeptidase